MTDTPLARFQDLLRELFQFDCADLDFGIYRVLNHKRDVIRRFIEEDLPRTIEEGLNRGQVADQGRAAKKLEALGEQIRSIFGAEAFDTNAALRSTFRDTPLGREYVEAQQASIGAHSVEGMATDAFNHLYRFFRRYYEDGDFISKRRYSKEHRYAIPYNGEEVLLHWATADQYYVKSTEHFRHYQFQSRTGVTVRFELQDADVEHDNVKGAPRFFLARASETSWDQGARRLVVPFEYRPLTAAERVRYGAKQSGKAQSQLLEQAAGAIRDAAPVRPECVAALDEPPRSGTKTATLLEYHLQQYTRRNTSDFFIHKDLSGFLTRELDSYLKTEVLSLDTLQAAGEERAEGWFQVMRVLRAVGASIIAFLAQIEDFQKMLWEKRKFVVETNYIVSVGQIPEEFYAQIASSEPQWAEWRDLFGCEFPSHDDRCAFLASSPGLPLDTRHFSRSWVDRVLDHLAAKDVNGLYGLTDGVLVHGENWNALKLLHEGLNGDVKLVYIDPPYNSKTSEILYKNNYKHSSWLSLMDSRLATSRRLSSRNGTHVIAIDENEQESLGIMLSQHFQDFKKTCVSIVHNKKGIQGDHLSHTHDYAYFVIPREGVHIRRPRVPKKDWEFMNLRKWGRESERKTAKNCFYPILVEDDRIVGFGPVCSDEEHPRANVMGWNGQDRMAVFPVDSKGIERKWRYARDSIHGIENLLKVHTTKSGEVQIHKAQAEAQIKTVWTDSRYIAGDYGTKWLTDLSLKVSEDLYPKSVHTIEDTIRLFCSGRDGILDYFAGSGTTGHAVINLNREDGQRRRFVLVEIGEHFGYLISG